MDEIKVPQTSRVIGKKIVDLNFPKDAIIAMIERSGKFLTPNGTTVIQAGDTLVVLSENESGIQNVYEWLDA